MHRSHLKKEKFLDHNLFISDTFREKQYVHVIVNVKLLVEFVYQHI